MTECKQEAFAFTAHFSRRVEAGFGAIQVSSDGGSLLLRETDRRINLLGRLASCFTDGRSPLLVRHRLSEMLSQRIYGLALGYEDLNDHEQLRADPLLAVLSGKRELDQPLAGKSTLNRLELVGRTGRYHKIGYSSEALDRLLVDLFVESHATPPTQIVLDLDATDIPLYGHQPERFFHGYYDSYCYLPLYIFAGDQLLSARLRPANQDAAAGAVEEVRRIVTQLRERWPEVKIVLRADSGFCLPSLTAQQWAAQDLYEKFYCARGEMENRIKEQMCLFADRLSTDEMKGNQLRLYFSALAYTLMEALRRLGLKGTEWAQAQVNTIRLKLLKIGAIVRISVRRILLQLSAAYPWKQIYAHAFRALRS